MSRLGSKIAQLLSAQVDAVEVVALWALIAVNCMFLLAGLPQSLVIDVFFGYAAGRVYGLLRKKARSRARQRSAVRSSEQDGLY